MSFDRTSNSDGSGAHNLTRILSPGASRSGGEDGSADPQQHQQHQQQQQQQDGAYRQSVNYQPGDAPRYQQSAPAYDNTQTQQYHQHGYSHAGDDYARYSGAGYEYPQHQQSSSNQAYTQDNQAYGYQSQQQQAYGQQQRQMYQDQPHGDYAEYRQEPYTSQQRDYDYEAQRYAYDYDRREAGRQGYPHQSSEYLSDHRSHHHHHHQQQQQQQQDEYYARYGYNQQTASAYGQHPISSGTPVAGAGADGAHHSASYYDRHPQASGTADRHAAAGYGYGSGHPEMHTSASEYGSAAGDTAYRSRSTYQTGYPESGYAQDSQIPDRRYNLDMHLSRQSGTQGYGYATPDPARHGYNGHTPDPAVASQAHQYQRSPIPPQDPSAYGTNPGYTVEMGYYGSGERVGSVERTGHGQQSSGFGIASLLADRPSPTSAQQQQQQQHQEYHQQDQPPADYAYQYSNSEYGRYDHCDRAGREYRSPMPAAPRYGDAQGQYQSQGEPHEDSHRMMSISQLVGSSAETAGGHAEYAHRSSSAFQRYASPPPPTSQYPIQEHEAYFDNYPGNIEVQARERQQQLEEDQQQQQYEQGQQRAQSQSRPPARPTEYDTGRSPDVPLAKRQSAWLAKQQQQQQGAIVVSDDDGAPALPRASAGKAAEPAAAFSDEDSQPLANRTASSLTLDQTKPPPAKRRRQSRAQPTRRRTSTSAGANAQSNNATGDDSTANSTKGTVRRKVGRKTRGPKKVELSSQYVYDEDADEDDPSMMEQNTAAFEGNGHVHRPGGDQEVAVPNAQEGDGEAAVTSSTTIHRSIENGDSSVDQHVQEYIQNVRRRNSRAIEKYEERSRQKYERMQEHIMRKYGPYLQRYGGQIDGSRTAQDEGYTQPLLQPREDEYDLMDGVREQAPGSRKRKNGSFHRSNGSQPTRRGQNGYAGENGDCDSPFAATQHVSMQMPMMGYFSPSRPASPAMANDRHGAEYDYGYRRNDSPMSELHAIEPQMTEEEIAQMHREDEARRQGDERKRMWAHIAVDYIPVAYRHMQANVVLRNGNMTKVAQQTQRDVRRYYAPPSSTKVIQLNPHQPTYAQKPPKELVTKARRSMREMLVFWKRHEKEEREMRKRAEKEAVERQRQEEEAREARRQARKLNFLITQTELYSHFIGDKISGGSKTDSGKPNGPSGPSTSFGELDFDEADEASIQAHAKLSAQNALAQQQEKTREFDAQRKEQLAEQQGEAADGNVASALDTMDFQQPETMSGAEVPQPHMLMCQLKEYQLKGLNWLANLYEQGINGILADEMGLGKTVQSISLLAYLAETHNIWGPFMVVAPASTLHNWQQELTRFVPEFKVLPYWGTQKDRKVLRKSLYNPQNLSRKDSAFHVLVTSYQLVVSDESYLNRVKWQYMVLDEAQAIKSSTSARWKTLLGFHCRNRLLLTGTPIQNSMQELWALLHFIMPTLFDSHEEFSEWFSRDIEAHAENRSVLNQHQLHRLHMILKPFMLRRNKRHVQHELGEKIEHLVPCDLTQRQKIMYRGLMSKISVPELLERVQNGGNGSKASKDDSDESLMNLVMQFRKVCSHPELFERAEVESPYLCGVFPTTGSLMREGDDLACSYAARSLLKLRLPKLIYRDSLVLPNVLTTRDHVLRNTLSLWTPQNIASRQAEAGTMSLLRLCAPSVSIATRAFSGSLAQRLDDIEAVEARECGLRQSLLMASHDNGGRVPVSLRHAAQGSVLHVLSNLFSRENLAVSPNLRGLAQVTTDEFAHSRLSIVPPAYKPPAVAPPIDLMISDRSAAWENTDYMLLNPLASRITSGKTFSSDDWTRPFRAQGGTDIWMPSMDKLIRYSGKMAVLDKLLMRLKAEGHRVLLYFQMTKMIDLFEEYLAYRKYTYLRLDGSSRISDRRDMVMDWQTRDDIFIFLLSTRAGGLGINLTAADTVIFFESDWNPTVDSQAMDRAHRLGQTKQVVVYRLITRGTVEERILQRARQKDEIHRIVIAGGDQKSAAAISTIRSGDAEADAETFGDGFSSNFEMNSKELVTLLLGEATDDEDKVRNERLVMERFAQATSNRLYASYPLPDVPDVPAVDGQEPWETAIVLPPPRLIEELPEVMSTMDAVLDAAIQKQKDNEAEQQKLQRLAKRGGPGSRGGRGRRGGGSAIGTQTREKRKPKARKSSAVTSRAGSRAGTPEPAAKRGRIGVSAKNSTAVTPKESQASTPAPTTALATSVSASSST